jgi:RNA polymerase sigma-70 factor (ECF subfamily)
VTFADAFRAEYPALHRYLRRRVGATAADDLAAEAFAIALRRWESFDQSRPLKPWLYGIASNLLRHHWRSERRQLLAYAKSGIDPVTEDLEDVLPRVDATTQRRQLAAAIARLRREDRELLLLHAWAGLSDAEIATALSLPVGTVKSRLHRARVLLGNRLSGTGQSVSAQVVDGRKAAG